MLKVKFLPSGEEHEIEFNETILHLAQREGIHIQSVCKGLPSCAECRIQIVDGEHHVLPPSTKEVALIGTAHYVDRSRLSCQLRCFGDVTVDLSEQIAKEKRAQSKPNDRMARSDGEKSKAVLGSIMENVVAEGEELPEEDLQSEKVRIKVESVKGAPKLDKRDSFYGDFYNKKKKKKKKAGGTNKNKNNRKKNGQKTAQASDSKKMGEGDPNRPNKRKRSRNRNRNPNKPKPSE